MFDFPVEVKAFLVVFLTNGIKSLLEQAGVKVTHWRSVLVAALVAAFIAFAAGLLGGLPPGVQEVILAVLTLLAGMGIYKTAKIIGTAANG